MTIQAHSADGTVHEFPDGTADDVVDKVMKQYAMNAGAKPEAAKGTFSPKGVGDNLITGAGETLLTLPGAPGELALRGFDWAAHKLTGSKRMTEEELAGNPIGVNMTRNMWSDWGGIPKPDAPKTTADKYARTVGGFMGGGLLTGPINPSALASSATAGVGSQVMSDALPDEWWAPFVGGLLGAQVPNVAASGARGLIPNTTLPRAQMAEELMNRGVPVAPGQLATNPVTRGAYDLSRKLSLFNNNFGDRQSTAVNRVAANTMGTHADEVTPQVMDATRQRIGNDFESIFGRNTVPIDQQAMTELGDIQSRAVQNLTEAQARDVNRALNTVVDEAANRGGTLPGRTYHAFTSKGGALHVLTDNRDPNIAFYGRQIRQALNGAFRRNAQPGDAAALDTAREQYRNMKTLQPLAAKSGEGDLSPMRILSRVSTNDKNSAFTGGGDLGLLGRAGQSFLKPPQTSGTAERAGLLGAGGLLATAGSNPVGALGAVALPMVIRRALESQTLTRAMIAKAMRTATPAQQRAMRGLLTIGQTTRTALPGMVGLLGRQNLAPQGAGLLSP